MLLDAHGRPIRQGPAQMQDRVFDAAAGETSGYTLPEDRTLSPEFRQDLARELERVQQRMDELGASGMSLDGFVNELTGLGTTWGDKTRGGLDGGPEFRLLRMSGYAAEQRTRGSDLGQNIVNKTPDEMTRNGWDLEIQPDDDDDEQERLSDANGAPPSKAAPPPPAPPAPPPAPGPLPKLNDQGIEIAGVMEEWAKDLKVARMVNQALRYERSHGGGVVFLGVDDGQDDLTTPLDIARVKKLSHLTAMTGGWDGEVVMWRPYNDPRKARYGEPEIFQVRNTNVQIARPPAPGETRPVSQLIPMGPTGPTIWYVHESRFLIFDGKPSSRSAQQEMRGWGDSIFTRVNEPLAQYEQAWNAVAVLISEFSIATLSIKNLSRALAEKGQAARQAFIEYARFQAITQSVARMRFIDADEKMERVTASIVGIADVIREWNLRLAAAVDQPVSLLFGQVKGALGGDSGQTDVRFFYDRIQSDQESRLRPALERLYTIGFRSTQGPTQGREPAKWHLKFRPLWQSTAGETADLRLKTSQADASDIEHQIITPEEVAATRYGGAEYNPGPVVLDVEGRMKATAAYQPPSPAGKKGPPPPLAAPAASSPTKPAGNTPPLYLQPLPMTAMPSSPVTGDPQSTPSNIGQTDDTGEPRGDEQGHEPAGSPEGGQFMSTSGGGSSGKPATPAPSGTKRKQAPMAPAPTKPVARVEKGGKMVPGAATGAQLAPEVRSRLKELGVRKLPSAHIAEVLISPTLTTGDPNKSALIKWRDDKGKIQSGYSREHERVQSEIKFARAEKAEPKIDAALEKTRELALTSSAHAAVVVIAETGLRPGSNESLISHGHYGVTTMEARHVTIADGKAHIEYVGKASEINHAIIDHPGTVAALQAHLAGKAPTDRVLPASKSSVRAAAPKGVLLKDMRTVMGTRTAVKDLERRLPDLTGDRKVDARNVAKLIREVSTVVATQLNNSPPMARKSYINPRVFKEWGAKHGLPPEWVKGPYDA